MSVKEKQFISEMKRLRDIDFARIGMQVQVSGYFGTIVGLNLSGNLDVKFSNQLRFGKRPSNCHPTWEICYYDENDNIIKDYREGK